MLAFAGNSLLCRLALRPHAIDALSFTLLRVASGAALLGMLTWFRRGAVATRPGTPGGRQSKAMSKPWKPHGSWLGRLQSFCIRGRATLQAGSWRSAVALAIYAIAFALAYVALDASTGTLVLFASVQVTMIGWGLAHGERPPARVWLGLLLATAGLLVLLLPGVRAPATNGIALMAIAGISWGVYSLRGRGIADPVGATAANFLRAVPLCLAASAVALLVGTPHLQSDGVLLACASGAISSGLGYVVWYAAVRQLTATRAAMAQLTVPVLAGLGGVLLLDENLSPRLLLAGMLVLGGIALAVLPPRP